jgi:hypothetical protein
MLLHIKMMYRISFKRTYCMNANDLVKYEIRMVSNKDMDRPVLKVAAIMHDAFQNSPL